MENGNSVDIIITVVFPNERWLNEINPFFILTETWKQDSVNQNCYTHFKIQRITLDSFMYLAANPKIPSDDPSLIIFLFLESCVV